MLHSFDAELARRYGILEAVLVHHLQFWIERNRQNGVNCFDGTCWTFRTAKNMEEQFPYVTQRQIRLALQRLIDAGMIRTGQFHKNGSGRTLWYAFTEKGEALLRELRSNDAGVTTNDAGVTTNDADVTTNDADVTTNDADVTTNDAGVTTIKGNAKGKAKGNTKVNGMRTGGRFAPPTREEVRLYCGERRNCVDADRFVDYYTANGWKVGKNPMKDWKAAVRTWEKDGKKAVRPRDDSLDDIF